MAGQDDRTLRLGDLPGRQHDLTGVTVEARLEARQVERVRMLGLGLAGEGILGEVDVDGARSAGAGDVEGLRDDTRDVVGLAHEVVVLRHRQRDAGDVDLLEGVLADERAGHVAGDGDHGHGVQLRRGDAGHQVRGAGTAGAEADADPPAGAGVAVGRVGSTLLVADEDGTQLGVVGPNVVERQDDAARVAEDDLHALADEGLAEGVGADARAVQRLAVAEHVAAGLLDGRCLRCPEGRHVTTAAGRRRGRDGGGGRRRGVVGIVEVDREVDCHRSVGRPRRAALGGLPGHVLGGHRCCPSLSSLCRGASVGASQRHNKDPRRSRRGSWWFDVRRALRRYLRLSPDSRREPVMRPISSRASTSSRPRRDTSTLWGRRTGTRVPSARTAMATNWRSRSV